MDYTYSGRRILAQAGISGYTRKGEPVVFTLPTHIIENRVNGRLCDVTILDSDYGKRIVRLTSDSVRY